MRVMTEKTPGTITKGSKENIGLTTVKQGRRGDEFFPQIYELSIQKDIKIEADSCAELDTEVELKSPEGIITLIYTNDEIKKSGLLPVTKMLVLDEYLEPIKVVIEVYNPTKKSITLKKDTKIVHVSFIPVQCDMVRFIDGKPPVKQ